MEDACRLLAEHGGGMDSLTHAGQRPCDLADEEVLSLLEELAQKQEDVSLGPPSLLSAPRRPEREGFLSPPIPNSPKPTAQGCIAPHQ